MTCVSEKMNSNNDDEKIADITSVISIVEISLSTDGPSSNLDVDEENGKHKSPEQSNEQVEHSIKILQILGLLMILVIQHLILN